MMVSPTLRPTEHQDILPINGTDFIEIYTGNAKQSALFYILALGFRPLAYKGLATGLKEYESYVVRQEKITIVFSSPLKSGTDMGRQIDLHGDGVKHIALWVDDASASFYTTVARGASSYWLPYKIEDDQGTVCLSGISLYGDTKHVFVERKNYQGVFLPGYIAWNPPVQSVPSGLQYIDHMVANVGWNQMNEWVRFYKEVMGFNQLVSFDDKDISTEYTALMSKVMSNGNGRIKFPINEPAEGKKKSQIEEYLQFYEGPGIQHIAMATDDIIYTVKYLMSRGIEFLHVPTTYYSHLLERVGKIDEDLETLSELGILVDRDEEGYLLQIFSKPIQPRPTLFFEIIQRKGAKSFGKGNFKALFEAIEREQMVRGTL
jgi:4-hydroxyphenylpyruvate dioxygenase